MSDQGLGAAVKETVNDAVRLVKLEAQLAGDRIKGEVKKKGTAAGAGVAGLLFILYGLLFLLAAGAAGLAILLPWWLALLIVGVALFALGGILGLVAKAGFSSPPIPPEVPEQIKEDMRWVREQSS
jgi:hypothetical protein